MDDKPTKPRELRIPEYLPYGDEIDESQYDFIIFVDANGDESRFAVFHDPEGKT